MPGYLSNRLIAFIPAKQADLEASQATIVEIQGDIEDLQLNVGV